MKINAYGKECHWWLWFLVNLEIDNLCHVVTNEYISMFKISELVLVWYRLMIYDIEDR